MAYLEGSQLLLLGSLSLSLLLAVYIASSMRGDAAQLASAVRGKLPILILVTRDRRIRILKASRRRKVPIEGEWWYVKRYGWFKISPESIYVTQTGNTAAIALANRCLTIPVELAQAASRLRKKGFKNYSHFIATLKELDRMPPQERSRILEELDAAFKKEKVKIPREEILELIEQPGEVHLETLCFTDIARFLPYYTNPGMIKEIAELEAEARIKAMREDLWRKVTIIIALVFSLLIAAIIANNVFHR